MFIRTLTTHRPTDSVRRLERMASKDVSRHPSMMSSTGCGRTTSSSTPTRSTSSGSRRLDGSISCQHRRTGLALTSSHRSLSSVISEFTSTAILSMGRHVQKTVAGCPAVLWQLRNVRRSVPACVYQTPVVTSILTRLNHGNATLVGPPAYLVQRLRSVMNAAARSTAGLSRSAHISSTLASLHWLEAPERKTFKLVVLTYHCLHCALLPVRRHSPPQRHAVKTISEIVVLQQALYVPRTRLAPSEIVHSVLQPRKSGTTCKLH